jgi:alpha-D-ribose 1-methylphosphonate 5-triphosphate synthase subunit PhnH
MTWDTVHDGRAAFHACMRAACEPGATQPIARPAMASDAASDHAAAVLLALLDAEITVATAGSPALDALVAEIRARTGALPGDVADADFVVVPTGHPVADLVHRGTPIAPERGATIVYVADAGCSTPVRLDGPGLAAPALVDLPLPATELGALREANRHGPVGVDAFIATPDGVCALPRSTEVEERRA